MTFFDRDTNFPWKSHGALVALAVPALGHGRAPTSTTAASSTACTAPISIARSRRISGSRRRGEDLKPETLFDGVTFDPAEPERYARGFAVNNLVA